MYIFFHRSTLGPKPSGFRTDLVGYNVAKTVLYVGVGVSVAENSESSRDERAKLLLSTRVK